MFYKKLYVSQKNICFIKKFMFYEKYMFYKKHIFLFSDTIFSTRVREGYNALINTQIFARVRKG